MNMRTLIFAVLVMVMACNKKNIPFNETRQDDLYLVAGRVYYSKYFSQSISLEAAQKELTKDNFPASGIQVKSVTDKKLNGVILSMPMEWHTFAGEKIEPSEQMKKPLNATFEIEKMDNGYKVTVQNIWFSNDWEHTNQENVVLEKYILNDKGFAFRSDSNTLRIIKHLCNRFESLFSVNPSVGSSKF